MARLDSYLRSIERFGATGATLSSGQAVTLKFPAGDRQATQVTPHDQLVILVREIAPPDALDGIDRNRPAAFDYESNGVRYTVSVTPRPGAWVVAIAAAAAGGPAPRPSAPAVTAAPAGDEMLIERGQYDGGARGAATPPATSGSALLDQITRAARAARATDVYLAAGAAPSQRANGELAPAGGAALDAETISRERGLVAPADARGAWTVDGDARFAYHDGLGRVRATLGRDARGPTAALRLLPDEPPPLDRVNLGGAAAWLGGDGLILVAGAAGAGKTTVLAALVRALGEAGRRVVAIEDPIELPQASAAVSQRALGEHVPSARAGAAAALREVADAIAIAVAPSDDAAAAVVDAVAGGRLVLVTVPCAASGVALEWLLGQLPADRRELGRALLEAAHLGTIRTVATRTGRTVEIQRRDS